MAHVFSRTHYCEDCAKAKRPVGGTRFAVQQTTADRIVVLEAGRVDRRETPYGFVPHFFSLDKIKNEEAIVTTACGVIGCGCEMVTDYDELGQPQYYVDIVHKRKSIMTIKDWNALVMRFKGWTGYNI